MRSRKPCWTRSPPWPMRSTPRITTRKAIPRRWPPTPRSSPSLSVLHDIGKVGIPEGILNKNGPLNPEEWDTMKSHVSFGAKILDPLAPLARIREMVLHHHEFYDGSGYPQALAGEHIPIGARIIAIADAYDTITSDRTYKKARSAPDALAELERCSNAQFDGSIVEVFVRTMRTLPNPVIEVAATSATPRTP